MLGPRPFPLVIAAPSGAGKTSLARELVRGHERCIFSVSATTRARRGSEQDGQDYHFVSEAEFSRLAESGELLEWAVVHGERYGTLRSEVRRALDQDRVVVLDIDVQGARQVRERLPEAVLVFVLPPSGAELIRRLEGRASESPEQVRLRMAAAAGELAAAAEFDYVIVNDDFAAAMTTLDAIVHAESYRVQRYRELDGLTAGMAAELDTIVQRSH
jgi:guanylate kinase